MKSIDIPNGFVVIGQMSLPVLIDFDDEGNVLDGGTELTSDGWLAKGRFGPELLALVHSVKGSENMLLRALTIVSLSNDSRPITAVRLGKANRLMDVAKSVRDKFMEDMHRREKEPDAPMTQEYRLSDDLISKSKESKR